MKLLSNYIILIKVKVYKKQKKKQSFTCLNV